MKKQKAEAPTLCKGTLRSLKSSELKEAAGGGRIRIPVGYADDGSIIYEWVEG